MNRDSEGRRYLLFDSGCGFCTRLAAQVEAEGGGRLKARDLRDPVVQALLSQAKAPPRWEPAVLEEYRGRVRVWYGLRMRLRLLWWLGPAAAWRVLRRIRALGKGEPVGVNVERRQLVSRGLAILGSLVLWTGFGGLLNSGRALAAEILSRQEGKSLQGGRKDWLASATIMDTRELSDGELARAAETLRSSSDTQQLRWLLDNYGLALDRAVFHAAHHILDSDNTLLAATASWVRGEEVYVAGHYALRRPVDGFQTGTSLYRVRGNNIQLLAASVNGSILTTRVGTGIQSHCAGCVDPNVGPWEQDAYPCVEYDYGCIYLACGTCAGWGAYWWTCVLLFCSYALIHCCRSWQHSCTRCPNPPVE